MLLLFVICRRYHYSLSDDIETKEKICDEFLKSFEKYLKNWFEDKEEYVFLQSSLKTALLDVCVAYDDKIKKDLKSNAPKSEDFAKRIKDIYERLSKKWKIGGFQQSVLFLENDFFYSHRKYFKNNNYNVFESEYSKVFCIHDIVINLCFRLSYPILGMIVIPKTRM